MSLVRMLIATMAMCLCAACDAAGDSAQIAIEPATTYQTMHGWEATADTDWGGMNESQQARILDIAADEVGITRLRVGIYAGTENTDRFYGRYLDGTLPMAALRARRYAVVNDNDDPNVINWEGFDFTNLDWRIEHMVAPLKRRLEERGQSLVVNVNYVAFTDQIRGERSYLVHQDPEEYAEFVLATYLHMQEKYGFVPDAWEVILEPDLVKEWPNGRMIGEAIVASARRLRAAGFTPRFIAPSVTNLANAVRYLDEMASVPGAIENVHEVSYHRYKGATAENVRALAVRAEELGLATSMLELWFGRGTYEVLHEDLVLGNVSSWQNRVVSGLMRAGPGGLTINEDVRYTRQYTHFVHTGAVRVDARSSAPAAFAAVAFVNPDNAGMVVIVKAARAGDVSITGLPEGRYLVSYAVESGSGDGAPAMAQRGAPLTTHIPGRGVITISATP